MGEVRGSRRKVGEEEGALSYSGFEKRINRLAYAQPIEKPKSGKVINVGSRIGTKITQAIYFRPVAFGLRQGGRGKK
jgi:hypothetical protein